MKKLNLIFCCCIAQLLCQGQANLVPNPSFEEFTNCPTGFSTIPRVTATAYDAYNFAQAHKWIRGSEDGTPDYFNSCANSNAPRVAVPQNFFGNIVARTGQAYAGISSVEHEGSHLEYLQIRLSEPMVAGHHYHVSYWVNLGLGQRNTTRLVAVDNLGATFSDSLTCPAEPGRLFTRGIINPPGSHITDTTGWTPVSGVYTAEGNEQWMVIGAFRRADSSSYPIDTVISNTSTSGKLAYYFIDDVRVTDLSDQTSTHLIETCNLDSVLTLNNPSFGKGHKHLWNTGDSSESLRVSPREQDVYWVITENDSTAFIDSFLIVPAQIGPVDITIKVNTLGTTHSFHTYQWILNGSIIPNATDSTYDVLENGNYQVIVSNEEGCTDTSEVYEVSNVSIKGNYNKREKITVYPNPSAQLVFIQAPFTTRLALYNLDGRAIMKEQAADRVNLLGIPNGIYLLHILDEAGRWITVEKIVKQNQ